MPHTVDLVPRRLLRPLAIGAAGLGIATVLAGCAAGGGSAPGSGSGSGSDGGSGSGIDSSADTSAEYADGEYTADGSYESPNGSESITVDLTLEGDIVTAVEVTPHATGGNSLRYQTEFSEGIADIVVGEDIDTLDVTRVAGSSLTSGGFAEAVEAIRSEAAA
jgi:uncharacterized protein with FMN-binding domain